MPSPGASSVTSLSYMEEQQPEPGLFGWCRTSRYYAVPADIPAARLDLRARLSAGPAEPPTDPRLGLRGPRAGSADSGHRVHKQRISLLDDRGDRRECTR